MKKEYEYDLHTMDIIPPLNGNNYAGKVSYMIEISSGADIGIDVDKHPDLRAERWGITKDEAKEKKRKDVEKWIFDNQ